MPAYRLICNQIEPLHHNGKIYQNGSVVMENVVVTEEEAKIMNERQSWTKLELIKEDEKSEEINETPGTVVKKKTYAQMNAVEREEYKKSKNENK